MSVSLEELQDEQIRTADVIEVSDEVREFRKQFWGQDTIPAGRAPDAPPHRISIVSVRVDSQDRAQLAALVRRIRDVKGNVPAEVQPYLDDGKQAIRDEIKQLEAEWERLDSQGTQTHQQGAIANKIKRLSKQL